LRRRLFSLVPQGHTFRLSRQAAQLSFIPQVAQAVPTFQLAGGTVAQTLVAVPTHKPAIAAAMMRCYASATDAKPVTI